MATLSIAAILAESAQRYPDRVAVMDPQRITYDEMWREARLYATVPRPRSPTWRPSRTARPERPRLPRFYASLGAVVVPVHALLTPEEIEYVLRDCGAAPAVRIRSAGRAGRQRSGDGRRSAPHVDAARGVARRGSHRGPRSARGAGGRYLPVDPDADAVILTPAARPVSSRAP